MTTPIPPTDHHPKGTDYLRAAVVQIGFHPAFTPIRARSLIEDPLGDAALPLSISFEAQEPLEGLRSRIAAVYVEQLRRKVVAILEWCVEWKVDVVVFPEYSLPPRVLADVAKASTKMVIVAGSHFVDRVSLRDKLYEGLGLPSQPNLSTAVCPVFSGGKLIACVPKLHPSPIDGERDALEPGKGWKPVELPLGISGPMGVLLCIDFIDDQDEQVHSVVSTQRERVRFWAVPSYTPSTQDFHEQAKKQATRYKQPTLYANGPEKGGSGVFVDIRTSNDAGLPWQLVAKEEGVLVVDVDFREVSAGKSTAYDDRAVARVVAAPSLVYKSNLHDSVYFRWLERLESILAAGGKDGEWIDRAAETKSEIAKFTSSGALAPTRKKRLEQFASVASSFTKKNELESLTAEIVLPPEILQLNVLEAALCKGALAQARSWSNGALDETEFAALNRILVNGSKSLDAGVYDPSTAEAKVELKAIIDRIRGDAALIDDPKRMSLRLELYSTGLQGVWKREFEEARELLNTEQYDASAECIERLAQAIGTHLDKDPLDTEALAWTARMQVLKAILHLNRQEREQARDILKVINSEQLGPNEWLSLARICAELEEVEKAGEWISRVEAVRESDIEPNRLAAARQVVMIKSGVMPDPLIDEPDILLRAAELSLQQGLLAQGVRYACHAASENDSLMLIVGAVSIVVRALHWTIFELAEGAQLLTPPEIETAVTATELWFEKLEQPGGGLRDLPLPAHIVNQLELFRSIYYVAIADPDLAERALKPSASLEPDSSRAMALARAGKTDEALSLLPKTEHPWLPEVQRSHFLSLAGNDDGALVLLRDLSVRYPGRGPIELYLAERELRSGNAKDSLKHAEQAYSRVPVRGYRWLLARCLEANGSVERAWQLAFADRAHGGSKVILMLATLSTTFLPSEAPGLWAVLVERDPENIQVLLALAESQGQLGHTEQAAETAWLAFQRFGARFTARYLVRCIELQLTHDPAGLTSIERVRSIAKLLHEQFAGDPYAESYKLQLYLRLGDDPELPHADFDVLEEVGLVRKFNGDDLLSKVSDWMRIGEEHSQATTSLYTVGGIPLATLAELGNQTNAELVAIILRGTGPKICAALPPSCLPHTLSGIEILTTDVELLALSELRLSRTLADSLIEHKSTLIVPLTYYQRLQTQLATLQRSAASRDVSELVRLALELVHIGRSAGWVRILTWPEAQEGLSERPIPEKPKLREAMLDCYAGKLRSMVETPLHEAIDLAAAVLTSPGRWRLTADFFGTWSPGTLDTMRSLAWSNPDHAIKTSWFLRSAGRRIITLPTMARLLADRRVVDSTSKVLERLARSGFPDAISGTELAEHARSASSVRFSEDVLIGLEHMARQTVESAVGIAARGHLEDTYSTAIAQAFLGKWQTEETRGDVTTVSLPTPYLDAILPFGSSTRGPIPIERAQLLTTTLLERLELLDAEGTTLLQGTMAGVLVLALRNPFHSVRPDPEIAGNMLLSLDSPVGRLVEVLRGWVGPSGARWATWGRAVRQSWCMVDKFADAGGPTTPLIAALLLASSTASKRGESSKVTNQEEHSETMNAIGTPADEAIAILSANWKERPLKRRGVEIHNPPGSDPDTCQIDWETILVQAANLQSVGELFQVNGYFDERNHHVNLPVPNTGGQFSVDLPVEAVLLRTSPDSATHALTRLSELQGPHDGKAYELLQRLTKTPNDAELRSEYARYTVMAPWRLVRDDPAFLMRWPQSYTTGVGVGFRQVGDLLSMLHEPWQPLGSVPSSIELIETRFTDTWRDLSEGVRSALYWQMLVLPGAVQTLPQKHDATVMAQNVENALRHFEHVHEVPAGWLAYSVMILRVAIQECPVITLARGTVDLRELVPSVIAKAVSEVSGAILPAGTMAVYEAMLLRMCARVCDRFLTNQPGRSEKDWLWLTYRLHSWFTTQLSKISPSMRQAGIESLARLVPMEVGIAPNAAPLPDLFNPYYFGARKFDYRLAMVLFALVASDELVRARVAEADSGIAVEQVSTPGLERQLLELAAQLPPDCAQATSWFDWGMPANSADLALVALLRLNGARISGLPEESVIARISAWPNDISTLGDGQQLCIHDLVVALSHHIREVGPAVREVLERKLLEWKEPDMASMLKWLGLTSLFYAGEVHLRETVWPLMVERYKNPQASVVLGWYLEGVVRAGDPLEGEAERIIAHWKGEPLQCLDNLVLAIARMTIHTEPPLREEASNLLAAFAVRAEFQHNSLLRELLKHLGLSDSKDGQ